MPSPPVRSATPAVIAGSAASVASTSANHARSVSSFCTKTSAVDIRRPSPVSAGRQIISFSLECRAHTTTRPSSIRHVQRKSGGYRKSRSTPDLADNGLAVLQNNRNPATSPAAMSKAVSGNRLVWAALTIPYASTTARHARYIDS